ncbi:MAG: GH3 auxin-responsive promoter family protein [Muribaculaceae bacterium]|nr:GH3 auxin-responsive promoter family protein [Muribaculaceae bacterium]
MNLTPFARPGFILRARRTDAWAERGVDIQNRVLRSLLKRAANTQIGNTYDFKEISHSNNPGVIFASRVPATGYEEIRADVIRMVHGERDILWPGRCMNYAQSSGTSGGRSKYIPITPDSLNKCHYPGAADCVAHYLRVNPKSRIFSGKAFVLGGSFASELVPSDPRVRIGDLSATLIKRINPLANHFRIPDMKTALLPDWLEKLPALVKASSHANVTNLSGVPSWFLTVIKGVMAERGVDKISDVWPNLEVFFHGGISFEPYRDIYTAITDPAKMHFMETYNASEGFFAVQNDPADRSMLLIIDNDIYYEFIDISKPGADAVPMSDVEPGKVYELLISSSNGLWRYHLGDTVRVESVNPVKITISGRTKTFINAFGEELMEDNAEKAMAAAARKHGATVANYTAAPVYATEGSRGRHQWLVEWHTPPKDIKAFADSLDRELRKLNSDYDAKRSHTLFLDPPEVIGLPEGTFNRWLRSVGTGKLGGQRKVPRLSNDRLIADAILKQFSKYQYPTI